MSAGGAGMLNEGGAVLNKFSMRNEPSSHMHRVIDGSFEGYIPLAADMMVFEVFLTLAAIEAILCIDAACLICSGEIISMFCYYCQGPVNEARQKLCGCRQALPSTATRLNNVVHVNKLRLCPIAT
jgi:hypothetical protein